MTPKRNLGKTGIEVSAMGMGCWAIGGPFWYGEEPLGWGDVDDNESISAVHACLEHDVNFFDTASIYGTGHSERVLGRAIAGRRDQVVIATKFGPTFDEKTRQAVGGDASPDGIRQSCIDSLRRLDTDYIDLFLFHFNDHPADKTAEILDMLEQLVTEGKIRSYGWSTDFPDRARTFAQGAHNSAVEFQLNVLQDNPALVEVCEEYGLAGINRGPLAMGLLTGKYKKGEQLPDNDVRGRNSPEWMTYFKDGKPAPDLADKVSAIREVLTSDGRTLVQGALGWLLARSPQMVPIPGIRTVAQAEENCKTLALGPLKSNQMSEINQILGTAEPFTP